MTDEPTTIDADAEELPTHSTALVARPSREVLMPLDTERVIEGMEAYQAMLPRLLDDSDWQGQPGAKGSFVCKSGWRKIARAFNLTVHRISSTVERDADGAPLRAEAVYRAIAPNGQEQDGDGYCAREESRFAEAKGRQKLENDLRATASTRAKNRAISDLVGMGKVSAEEAGQAGGHADELPHGPAADEQAATRTTMALAFLCDTGDGPNGDVAEVIQEKIIADLGYLPKSVARALLWAASTLKSHIEGTATTPAPASAEAVAEAPAEEAKHDDRTAEEVAEAREALAAAEQVAEARATLATGVASDDELAEARLVVEAADEAEQPEPEDGPGDFDTGVEEVDAEVVKP